MKNLVLVYVRQSAYPQMLSNGHAKHLLGLSHSTGWNAARFEHDDLFSLIRQVGYGRFSAESIGCW